MSASLLYYISGHGFGHARRCAETIRLLNQRHPDLQIHIRTTADASIFTDLKAQYARVEIDRGAVERDALNIDWPATLGGVLQLVECRQRVVDSEAHYIREHNIGLIVADAPFMAGYVAEAVGVPCWAQCNFLWDWIYEPHTNDRRLLHVIADGYRRMAGQLRLPFPHACDHFSQLLEVPFITSPLTLTMQQARTSMGIAEDDVRKIVLIGMRGGTSNETLARLKPLESRYLFITPRGPLAAPIERPLRFWDAMQVCDAVVSKPGHGIVTDCATLGVALLHPKRNGFREDPMIIREGARYFRERNISTDDYESGNWGPHLDALLEEPKPAPATNTNGREFVADFVAQQLQLSGR